MNERFAQKFEVRGLNDCWPWMGQRLRSGYGVLSIDGRMQRAHRVMWELEHGSIPDGMWVLHHCDNPPCVNPNHLWLGTHSDNMRDMKQKGRAGRYRGPHIWRRKFSDNEVEAIRKMRDEDWTVTAIAKQFDCSISMIHNICSGKQYKEVV